MTDAVATPPGTQAVDRAALLIDTVVRAEMPLTFLEIAESSGLPRSTTSRLLAALERTGLLERNAAGSYVAGRLFGLYATRHDPFEQMVRLARPAMERLGKDTGETVHLSVARNGNTVQVAQTDSRYLLGSRDWSDIEVPDHCSSLGKVLYAWGSVDLPSGNLARPTPASISTLDALRRDLEEVRRRGWAVTVDELEEGLSAVAAPVHGPHGDVVAALGISGPTQRLGDRLDVLGRQIKTRAGQLSVLLGSRVHQEGVA